MTDEELFLTLLLEDLSKIAAEKARPQIPSKTLRDAMQVIVDTGVPEARLFIPHYWAVYLHDGRGPIFPQKAEFLVFFNNLKDDPRIQGGYPERASQVKRLTRAQFEDGLLRNAERRRRGLPPFMFVLDNTGPAEGTPFFTDGMVGFANEVTGPATDRLDAFVQSIVDEVGPETDEATFNL